MPTAVTATTTINGSFPAFLPAKRYAGFVDVPEYEDGFGHATGREDWNSTKFLVNRSEDSCSHFPDLEHFNGKMAGPTRLQRTITMNGNIVVFEPDQPTSQGFWLQRKVAQSSLGVVRVAYKLRRSPNSHLPPAPASTTSTTSPTTSRAWQLDVNEEGRPFLVEISMINKKSVLQQQEEDEEEGPTDDVLAQDRVRNELQGLQRIADQGSPEVTHVAGTKLIGTCSSFIYVVLPYFPDGTLLQYCQSKGNLKEPVARFLFQQILQGLKTLHNVRVCHRNLSMDAICLHGDVAVINHLDWCLPLEDEEKDGNEATDSKRSETRNIPVGNHPQYLAPEYFGRTTDVWDGFAVDLWATGLMLYGMVVSNNALFAAPVPEDKIFQELCVKGRIKEMTDQYAKAAMKEIVLSDELVDLLTNMLQVDPLKRFSLDEVLQHPWVQNDNVVAPSLDE